MRIRKLLPTFSVTPPSSSPPAALLTDPLHRRTTAVQLFPFATPPFSGDSSLHREPAVHSGGKGAGGILSEKTINGIQGFGGTEDDKKEGKQCAVGRGCNKRKTERGEGGEGSAIENPREWRMSGAAAIASTAAVPAPTLSSIQNTRGGIQASFSAVGANVSRNDGVLETAGEKSVPLKKRRRVMQETVQDEGKTNNHVKTKTSKKQECDDGEEEEEEKEKDDGGKGGNGNGVAAVKKKGRGGALMEGSRCSRVNGRGWRCCQQTLVGYSLCEHHLGKGRVRSLTSVRSSTAAAPKIIHAPSPPPFPSYSSPESQEWYHSSRLDADEEYDYEEEDSDYDEQDDTAMKKRKPNRIGMVKARLLSSLLGQPETSAAAKPNLPQG